MKTAKIFALFALTAIAVFLFGSNASAANEAVSYATLPGILIGAGKASNSIQSINRTKHVNPFKGTSRLAYAGGDISDYIVTPRSGKPWSWTLKLVNNTDEDQTVTLVPGYNPVVTNGIIAEGGFNSIEGGSMNGQGKPDTITHFLKLVAEHELHCAGINMTYNNDGQKGKSLILLHKSLPFVGGSGTGQDEIEFSDYNDPKNVNDKQLIITEGFDIVRDTQIQLTVAGSGVEGVTSTVFLTFKFDYMFSRSAAFRSYSLLVAAARERAKRMQ